MSRRPRCLAEPATGTRRPLAAIGSLVLLASALAAAGCGGVRAGDFFILNRSGSTPHAALTLLVNEEGKVNCNGGPTRQLSDPEIVKARALTEELEKYASEHLSLPARPGSVLRYRLRDANGTVAFSDNSAGQPKVTHELSLFVLKTAQEVCGLPE